MQKKVKTQKIQLNKETVRRLGRTDLHAVVGGGPVSGLLHACKTIIILEK